MNVLHVYRTYFPETQGGLEEAIRQICINTSRYGASNRVFTLSKVHSEKKVLKRSEADVFISPLSIEISSCGISFAALREFKQHVEWADIINYHFPWPYADVLHVLSAVRQPTVVTYHSDIVRQKFFKFLYAPLMHQFLSSVDVIVATSPNYVKSSKVLSKYGGKVEVIPLGIDVNSYPVVKDMEIEFVRKKYGQGFFLFIGVLRYYKGLHILLAASVNADFKVVVAGAGPELEKLQKQAKKLNLVNVDFIGRITDDEKMALLTLCRAVVFPSCVRSEAFGVTLLEGAMQSKPMITAEIGTGTSYVNIHNETGLVVTHSDPISLRQAMDAINSDDDLAIQFGMNAKARFEKCFSGDNVGSAYAGLYERILS